MLKQFEPPRSKPKGLTLVTDSVSLLVQNMCRVAE
jgi:hypothetical protein